jgi:hypothetical protein
MHSDVKMTPKHPSRRDKREDPALEKTEAARIKISALRIALPHTRDLMNPASELQLKLTNDR